MRLRYAGPGPQEDPDGGLVRPGEVREFETEPDWGPWEPAGGDEDRGPESPAEPPAVPSPAAAPERQGAASTAAAGSGSEPAPGGGKGM